MKPDPWPTCRLQAGIRWAVLATLATTPAAQADPGVFVRDTTYVSASDFGPDSLLIRELEFSGPTLSAVVDASSGVVVVALPDRRANPRRNRLVAYELDARRVIWEKSTGLAPIHAIADRILLGDDTRMEIVRLADGMELGDIDGAPFMWEDGVALRVTDDRISRWDPGDGHDLWTVDRGVKGTVDDLIRRDTVAYLVAEGIQQIDLRNGLRWSYSIGASRKDLYSTGDGGTEQVRSLYGGTRVTNLTAAPLIDGPDVYFAADTTVVRLKSGSGAVRWSRHLPRQRGFSLRQRALGTPSTPEFLGRLVLRDAGSNVAVASLGWALGPKYWLRADPPTVALLAKSDGRVLARVQVPGMTILYDLHCTPVGCYLVAPDRVLLMDDSLRVRATFRASVEFQPLGRLIDARGAIVLTSSSGILALSPDSLNLVWSRRCGRTLAIDSDWSDSNSRHIVTTQGLIRLDKGDELRPNAYYPLRGSWAELRDGWLLLGGGRRLSVVTLVERKPPPRFD